MRFAAFLLLAGVGLLQAAHAQLLNGYTGDEPGAKSWIIDVTNGEFEEGGAPASRAMAADPDTPYPEPGWIYSIRERFGRDDPVDLQIGGVAPAIPIVDSNGFIMLIVSALAYGDGVLYGYGRNSEVNSYGLGTIDTTTGVFTYLFSEAELGDVSGLTYDHDRHELLVGIQGSVFVLDLATGALEFVASGSHDGLAYGYNRIYMVCGSSNVCPPITVYNRATERYESDLPLPGRNGNGFGGATFVDALAASPPIPALERYVQLRGVDFTDGIIELFNFGDVDVALDGWRFCSHDFDQERRYTAPNGFDGTSISAGGSVFVHFNNDAPLDTANRINRADLGGALAEPLDQDAYALQVFFPDANGNVDFGESAQIADHLQWNIDGLGAGQAEARTQQAVDEGLWSAIGDFVATTALSEFIELVDLSGDEFGQPDEYFVEAGGIDSDGDGVTDDADNCILTANTDQRDTDGDGIGNICDADIAPRPSNDCLVDGKDIRLFRATLGSAVGDNNYLEEADFNGDGIIDRLDTLVLLSRRGQPPGPSGLDNRCDD